MTDLEKWEKFLTEMGIVFKVDTNNDYDFDNMCDIETKVICVGVRNEYLEERGTPEYSKWFATNYRPSLDIIFDMDGKFKYFQPCGE